MRRFLGMPLLLTLAVLAAVLTALPSGYFILSPAGTYEIAPRLEVPEQQRHEVGRLAFTAVLAQPGSWADVLTAWMSPRTEAVPAEAIRPRGASQAEVNERNRILIEESKLVAAVVGLRAAGFEAAVTGEGAEVGGVLEGMPAEGLLQPGDIIVAVNGAPTRTAVEVIQEVRRHEPGDQIQLGVLRDGERLDVVVGTEESPDEPGRPIIGVGISTYQFDVELPFPVEIETETVGGPSAGLMFALGILDATTEGLLTRGHFVAGTGTISADGTVGPIGGAAQKVIAARQDGADVFLVPRANYEEARRVARGIQLVPVDRLADAVRALCGLEPEGEALAERVPPSCLAYGAA